MNSVSITTRNQELLNKLQNDPEIKEILGPKVKLVEVEIYGKFESEDDRQGELLLG